MPGMNGAFLPQGGTILLSVSTAPTPVQISTAGVQGLLLTNLSTVAMQVLIASSSLTTMSTLSTAALVPGILMGAGVNSQITVSCPPNPWVSGMTTATALTGMLGVSPGMGSI